LSQVTGKAQDILNYFADWFFDLLTDEAPPCRIAAQWVVAFLIPHTYFESKFEPFPNLPGVADVLKFESRPITSEIIANAKKYLGFLRDRIDDLLTAIREKQIVGQQYFMLMNTLSEIAEGDTVQIFLPIVRELTAVLPPFDMTLNELYQILGHADPVKLAEAIVLPTTGFVEGPPHNVHDFLKIISPIFPNLTASDEFIEQFVKTCVFPQQSLVQSSLHTISSIFSYLLNKRPPSFLLAYVSANLEQCCQRSLSSVVMTLETFGEKLPVLRYLSSAIGRRESLNHSDLVIKTIDSASDCDDPLVAVQLIPVLNQAVISQAARAKIWALLKRNPPPAADFVQAYKRKDEPLTLVEVLTVRPDPAAKPLLLEAAQATIVAFARAYDALVAIAADDILDPGFASSILALDFQDEPCALVRYLTALLERAPGDRTRILRPVVERTRMHAHFLNSVLEDVAVLTAADVSPLIGMLEIARDLGIAAEISDAELRELKGRLASRELAERVQLPEIPRLAAVLAKLLPE
jgi:hypothetical protein